jgi:flagellar basal body P-ring formation protein FlgA
MSLPKILSASLLLLGAASASAVSVTVPTAESVARDTVLEALAPVLAARGATARVDIAPSDARRGLAACTQMSGFMAPGTRLVGKTLVGVKCLDGANWQTFVSIDVKVEAPVWQATHALPAGSPIAAADVAPALALLTQADLDATSGRSNTMSRGLSSLDGRQPPPVGRTLQRPVGPAHALTVTDLREEGRINAGDAVRVVYQGEGFAVTSEGRTVGPADPGGPVQIRLASGAVVAGTLRADRQVELAR